MKFSTGAVMAVLGAAAMGTTTSAFVFHHPSIAQKPFVSHTTLRMSTAAADETAATTTTSNITPDEREYKNKKEKRLRIMKEPTFHRRGFKEFRKGVEDTMADEYESTMVKEMRTNEFVLERDNVKVHLAKDFGFCWGVERSIALAYEAVNHYPDRKIHITNELIHNPEVNDKLQAMDVKFIEKVNGGGKRFDTVKENDVVILPAFGASLEEMAHFDEQNVELVDTTCPWVSKVWNTVDKHQKNGLTSVIHGKYAHEETVATVSFCEDYICVKNMKEAEMVADYILNGGDRDSFLEHFKYAVSDGFDPDTMLSKVGLANQTTMYKKETRAIGQLLQKTMMKKYGPVGLEKHYMEFDTICDATQERQDAVDELVEKKEELGLDFILVIGGWDSSNTAHLLEIPVNAGVKAYHINRADCITADNTITHRNMEGDIVTEPFLPTDGKKVVMGVTSGASTPDAAVQESLGSLFLLKNVLDEKAKTEEA